MEDYKAGALPHELLCRVQNLFPDVCDLCKKNYCVRLRDKPIVSCVRCGQGCHNECVLQLLGKTQEDLNEENQNGVAILNPNATVGLFYLCRPCQIEVIPQKEELKIRKLNKKSAVGNPEPPSADTLSPPESAVSQSASSNCESPETTDKDSTNDNLREVSHMDANFNNEIYQGVPLADASLSHPVQQQSTTVDPRGQNDNNESQTCKFYKQGRCKHGISGKKDGTCKNKHPKPCKKLLANGNRSPRGCIKGNRCDFFHPKMCLRSLKERICLRVDCKYLHVKGTNRTDPSSQINSNDRIVNMTPQPSRAVPNLMEVNIRPNPPTQPKTLTNSLNAQPFQEYFLEQMKFIRDQMTQFGNKIQQLDVNFSRLNLQQHGNTNPVQSYPTQTPIGQTQPQYSQPQFYLPSLHPHQYAANHPVRLLPPPQTCQ